MKRKLYTLSHNTHLLKDVDSNGGQFTAEEHAYVMEKELAGSAYKTRENCIRQYLLGNLPKLEALGFLVEVIKAREFRQILSLGAGQCVLEYLLQMACPQEIEVCACDFDAFLIERAKKLFPEITAARFDFGKDELSALQHELQTNFDVAVFFGSAYVMDDRQFIKLLSDLKESGVKQIIDFHAGYMDIKHVISNYLPPRVNAAVRRVWRKPPITEEGYRGKCHGYSRSRGELRRLYNRGGLEILSERAVAGYKYMAILG